MARQPSAATSSEIQRLMRKGSWLHAMIRSDSTGALLLMREDSRLSHKRSSQSKWTNPRDLRDHGWTSNRYDPMWQTRGVDDVLEDLHIRHSSTDKDVKIVHRVCSVRDVTLRTKLTMPQDTDAQYCQVIKVRDGLIMPYFIWSPAEEARRRGRSAPDLPLAQYSDVLFLEYSKMAERAHVSVRNIKYILFHNVENTQTWAAVLKLFDRRGKLRHRSNAKPQLQLRSWPGERFSMRSDRDETQALLATPLGATVAWLLIQHKSTFAGKDVRSVRWLHRIFSDAFLVILTLSSPFRCTSSRIVTAQTETPTIRTLAFSSP